jgi:hypothetical protein
MPRRRMRESPWAPISGVCSCSVTSYKYCTYLVLRMTLESWCGNEHQVQKKISIEPLTLFHGTSKSPEQLAIENRLLQVCYLLTIGKRCADWFLFLYQVWPYEYLLPSTGLRVCFIHHTQGLRAVPIWNFDTGIGFGNGFSDLWRHKTRSSDKSEWQLLHKNELNSVVVKAGEKWPRDTSRREQGQVVPVLLPVSQVPGSGASQLI